MNLECYVAFIDLTKAFDSVSHEGLCRVLAAAHLPPSFIQLVQSLYTDLTATVPDPCGEAHHVPVLKGIRQGCPLSATLFNIFTSYIARSLNHKEQHLGPETWRRQDPPFPRARSLFYADDVTLFANTRPEMQRLLMYLEQLCDDLQLTINIDKTSIMDCSNYADIKQAGKQVPAGDPCFMMRRTPGMPREPKPTVTQAVYLGALFTNDMSYISMMNHRLKTAKSASSAVVRYAKQAGVTHARQLCTLMHAMVEQTLLYASEVWGPTLLSITKWHTIPTTHTYANTRRTHPAAQPEPSEQQQKLPDMVHNSLQPTISSFYKKALNISLAVSHVALLLELGQLPVHLLVLSRVMNFVDSCMPDTRATFGQPPYWAPIHEHQQYSEVLRHYLTHFLSFAHDQQRAFPEPTHCIQLALEKWKQYVQSFSCIDIKHDDAQYRQIATYVQCCWNGKLQTRHCVHDMAHTPHGVFVAWLRMRLLLAPLPAYTMPRIDKDIPFGDRVCGAGCGLPADMEHALLCCPYTRDIRSQYFAPVPAQVCRMFDSDRHDQQKVARYIYRVMDRLDTLYGNQGTGTAEP
jgi:hypothetical protein